MRGYIFEILYKGEVTHYVRWSDSQSNAEMEIRSMEGFPSEAEFKWTGVIEDRRTGKGERRGV